MLLVDKNGTTLEAAEAATKEKAKQRQAENRSHMQISLNQQRCISTTRGRYQRHAYPAQDISK
jgi:hypothetical protein